MGQESSDIGQSLSIGRKNVQVKESVSSDFVLEKSIFSNVFEKDIRRVYIYKKAERLAKAIHLISPAFAESLSLRTRIDSIALGLVDAALLPPNGSRGILSKELLALSSVLAIARTGGFLSPMNADLIAREAHALLQEVASYEEPRLFLEESPSLSSIARSILTSSPNPPQKIKKSPIPRANHINKGHNSVSDTAVKDRRQNILSVIKDKGKVGIKDISLVIRGVSEKTIQRELAGLVGDGVLIKEGERRWSTYTLASS